MSLETELMAAYDELAAAAPNRHALDLHSVREPRHRARIVIAVAATVAVLAAVPGYLLAAGRHSTTEPGGNAALTPSGIDWTWQFTVKAPSGFVPQLGRIYISRQTAEFNVTPKGSCSVTMYGEHLFDASRMNYRGQLDVNGATAYYDEVQADPHVYGSVKQRAIVWKAFRDNWVMVACWGVPDVRATELSLARSVHIGTTEARVPFMLGHLPAGYRVVNAIVPVAGGPLAGKQAVVLLLPLGVDVDAVPSDTSIDVSWFAGTASPTGQELTVNGHRAWFSYSDGPKVSDLFVELDGSYLQLRAQNPQGSQQKALTAIARGLVLAPNPLDPSTWLPAPDALP